MLNTCLTAHASRSGGAAGCSTVGAALPRADGDGSATTSNSLMTTGMGYSLLCEGQRAAERGTGIEVDELPRRQAECVLDPVRRGDALPVAASALRGHALQRLVL